MKKDVEFDSFKRKCEQLGLELLSDEAIDGKALIGCSLHGGAWSVSMLELTLKNKLANCPDCFNSWLRESS